MGIRHERCRMSTTVGPSRTFQSRRRMSAFGGKADIASASQNVRLRPKADISPTLNDLTPGAFPGAGLSRYHALS
jgi:hypothetical protein